MICNDFELFSIHIVFVILIDQTKLRSSKSLTLNCFSEKFKNIDGKTVRSHPSKVNCSRIALRPERESSHLTRVSRCGF